jgi:hypothetical protein
LIIVKFQGKTKMNDLEVFGGMVNDGDVLEHAILELVGMFKDTNRTLWFDAISHYHQNPNFSKSVTAKQLVDLAKKKQLQVRFDPAKGLVLSGF